MDVINLCLIFGVIILVLWIKKPLSLALILATIATSALFALPFRATLLALMEGAVGRTTLKTIAIFYSTTFLQRMLEKRNNLDTTLEAMDGLFHNRRISVAVVPAILGMLPSASTVVMCGSVVRSSVEDALTDAEKASITSFFRHITESFLPTYSSIFIAISLTNGRVQSNTFLIAMIPMVMALGFSGWFIYLRRIPCNIEGLAQGKKYYLNLFFKNTWAILLSIFLILVLNIPVAISVLVSILLNAVVNRFTWKELSPFFKTALEPRAMLVVWLIMLFQSVLAATGVVARLPGMFAQLPIPVFLVFALIFFAGTTIAGIQAMVALCIPMVMSAVPQTQSALPLFVLVMCMGHSAMQISPTHICLSLCAQDYHISLGAMMRKSLPMVVLFCSLAFGYYGILVWFLS